MRIPSGSTDRKIYFVAKDETDKHTRETGLASFTVVRSRDGGADATYTTPTIAEIDATTMPGVYALTVDEDTTIGATHDTEEYCVHITHAGMAPVTRTVELYRPKATEGRTLGIESDGDLTKVNTLDGHTPQTGDSFARIGATGSGLTSLASQSSVNTIDDFLDTEVAAILLGVSALLDRLGAWTGTGSNTVLGALRALFRKDADAAVPSDINTDLGSGEGTADNTTDSVQAIRDRGDAAWITATGFSTLDAAGVRSAVGLASANLDTQLGDIPTVAEFEARTIVAANYGTAANQATIASYIDTEVGAIKTVTDAIGSTAATRLGLMFAASRLITVDDATFSPTTTVFETDQTTDESAVYSEQVLFALDGGNVGMTVRITGYAFTNSKVKLTVDALKVAPSDGHRFLMMGRIEQG